MCTVSLYMEKETGVQEGYHQKVLQMRMIREGFPEEVFVPWACSG